jgi:hypothetical protein
VHSVRPGAARYRPKTKAIIVEAEDPPSRQVTLEIYARVLKRRDRDDIGRAFDHLLLGRDEAEPDGSGVASKRATRPSESSRASRNSR